MKKLNLFIIITFLFAGLTNAQVAINSNGAAADSSAMLDVVSTDKGILIPRVVDTTSVTSPATGLLIYRTTSPQGFFYYNGLKWDRISSLTLPLSIANGGTGSSSQNFVDLATSQTVGGLKTWSNLGTFSAGLASTGAIINLNSSSNFATNINNGTSTGAVGIANGTVGGNAITIGNVVGATGITQRVGTGNFSLDGVAGSIYTFGASTTTGTITIGGTAQTGAIGIGTGTGVQTLNIGTGGTNIKTINIGNNATPANIVLIGGAASTTTIGSRSNTIGIAGTANGNGVRIGNGRVAINKPVAPITGLTGNTTATVTQILDAGIFGFNTANNRTLTLPTARGATGLVQALPGTPAAGDVFTFVVFNEGTGLIRLVAGTGIALVNTNRISSATGSRVVHCRVTSVTPGAEAISVY